MALEQQQATKAIVISMQGDFLIRAVSGRRLHHLARVIRTIMATLKTSVCTWVEVVVLGAISKRPTLRSTIALMRMTTTSRPSFTDEHPRQGWTQPVLTAPITAHQRTRDIISLTHAMEEESLKRAINWNLDEAH